MCEVRGGSPEELPESEVRGYHREEPPCIQDQGWCPRPGAAPGRSNPKPEARGGDREEQPHVQGAVAARAQEGLEEPSHVEGQEGRWEEIPLIQGKEQRLRFAGDTPCPR